MKYAFLYPGQGSQSLNMGLDFIANFKVAKELSQRASEVLKCDFEDLLKDESRLNLTQFTQPAIFTVSAMAQAIFESESEIRPTLAFGHSLGEVSSYCLNGGASFEDGVNLTHKRGEFMAKACEDKECGMLVVLGLKESLLKTMCEEERKKGAKVYAANFNLEGQTVLAGIKKDLESFMPVLKEAGAKRTLLLNMSVASHCDLLQSACAPFETLLESKLQDSKIEVISNATLELYKSKDKALVNLTSQLIMPVRYHECVEVAKLKGITCFIEFGNGTVLAGLNAKLGAQTLSINNTESLKGTLGKL
ncbi:[acyl-carrier-protein] S-malonyltransferase [Helicobacter sp. 13S00401-1]|uniref:ACP S-malonyltransferase n=1 Tax=Helicobacter sp. 13S00401-1 TaxID=1905758 RepID=UPI000BA58707|nr:ACP S-malonyltransferase [Helicobacter sp. 13S00401-1]PAF49715.1 [acyl-carrier-protein] S-malonyltransferase [Helicobacter sp. 13S00401-1]